MNPEILITVTIRYSNVLLCKTISTTAYTKSTYYLKIQLLLMAGNEFAFNLGKHYYYLLVKFSFDIQTVVRIAVKGVWKRMEIHGGYKRYFY